MFHALMTGLGLYTDNLVDLAVSWLRHHITYLYCLYIGVEKRRRAFQRVKDLDPVYIIAYCI